MLIADAQVHIWAANTPERPWPARHAPHQPVPFSKDDLLREMDAAGVQRAVLVPPSWEGERNDLALAAARANPDRFAVMGRLDTEVPASRGVLATWRRQAGMLGLRFTFSRPGMREPLTDGRLEWLWNEAEAAALPIMVMVPRAMVELIDRVAERHPGLKLVMDHRVARRRDCETSTKETRMIKEFSTLYIGHIDLENTGFLIHGRSAPHPPLSHTSPRPSRTTILRAGLPPVSRGRRTSRVPAGQ